MASYQYIYVMKGLNKTFPGGKQVLKDIWLSFLPGAKIGVLGLNGAGKSTLLKIMAGEDDNFTGEAWAAEGVNVGFLKQEPELDPKKDVLGNVMDGAGEMARMLARFEEVSNAFSDPDADMDKLIAEQAELQEKIDAGNGWDLGRQVEIALDALRCPPSDSPVDKLSGGEKRRVALCRLLLSKPDMLLLDEPTNHLDAESVAWLERHLAEFPGTVVAVTHDRYFLDNVAGWILELDRGAGIPWEGNYSSWLEQKEKRLAPAGGWHRVEVRVKLMGQITASASVGHVGVGEVFVVAGQSNSANHGEEKQATQTGCVAAFDGSAWQLANDPQPGASGRGGSFAFTDPWDETEYPNCSFDSDIIEAKFLAEGRARTTVTVRENRS